MFSLSKIIKENGVVIDLRANDRFKVIKEIVLELSKAQKIDKDDIPGLMRDLIDKERVSSAERYGYAFPHTKHPCITKLIIAIGLSKTGIDWDSKDGKPVNIVFLCLAPADAIGSFLNVMSRLSYLIKSSGFDTFKKCNSNTILKAIERAEREI